ncbi:endonuclease/exonuclease/phosphatase family protein [Pseudonocardia sp.]|uniref:endonuclease/exonuclease/phosphatase family protein n=1 Tax=Pseudonocardia sp. TaxID=60912 RepID=UPI00261CCF1F|nr:endonuclease/exonuclease/phosphatase family protein [Pseudonocardia sp.]
MRQMRVRAQHVAGRVVGAVFVLGLALVLLPDLVLLDHVTPFAQLVAFRPVVLAGAAAVAAGPLVVLLLRRRARWFVAAVLAVLVTATGTLATRALPGPDTDGPVLTVLALNVHDGGAPVGATAALIADERPDLVALPEAGAEYRSRLAPLVEPLGYRLFGSTGEGVGDIDGVSALAHADLGDVTATVDPTTPFPSVVLTGGALGALRFVGFHSIAPVPGRIRQWRSDLAHVATWCAAPTAAIVAGDFNATLDHSAFRSGTAGCGDAAEQAGAGLVGTWPSSWPRAVGTQIDHVVATRGLRAESLDVHDVTGTDHRAVLSRLRQVTPPDGGHAHPTGRMSVPFGPTR